jgi:ABC-2 type transport system ATP-binding protein
VANVIEVEGLRKVYSRRGRSVAAVDGLDLVVPEGGVFGLLGPNGSGKTTMIRCLLGLIRPTAGRVELLGGPVPAGLGEAMRRTGAIVEAPALFPTMTGRENLRLLGAIDGIGRGRVDDTLELVGLGERAGETVRKYSLGMRQRLALAAAILKEPDLLILDEPANGLDPAGMREVRELVARLASEGRSVFVSSHVLAEVEQICDRVAILARGRCVAEGTVNEVVAKGSRPSSVEVRVPDLVAGERALRVCGLEVERRLDSLHVGVEPAEAGHVTEVLASAGQWVTELRPHRFSLEDVFLELTSEPGVDPSGRSDDRATLEEIVP